jgi:hypothetical protein
MHAPIPRRQTADVSARCQARRWKSRHHRPLHAVADPAGEGSPALRSVSGSPPASALHTTRMRSAATAWSTDVPSLETSRDCPACGRADQGHCPKGPRERRPLPGRHCDGALRRPPTDGCDRALGRAYRREQGAPRAIQKGGAAHAASVGMARAAHPARVVGGLRLRDRDVAKAITSVDCVRTIRAIARCPV